jgi:hypothetical protein
MDSLLDMVRFLIGDTDPNFPLISDDEIATCIGTKTDITRMYGPAADACAAIVARFSKYPQTGIAGDVKVDPKEVVAQFLALEKKLRSHDFVIGFGGLVCRRTGQIRRKPFYEGQFDDRSY